MTTTDDLTWFDELQALWVRCYADTDVPPPALDVDDSEVVVPPDDVRADVWNEWRRTHGITIMWRDNRAYISYGECV